MRITALGLNLSNRIYGERTRDRSREETNIQSILSKHKLGYGSAVLGNDTVKTEPHSLMETAASRHSTRLIFNKCARHHAGDFHYYGLI